MTRYFQQIREITANVQKIQPAGIEEYYASLTPNEWTRAFERLEEALCSNEPHRIENRILLFEATLRRLIEDYKKVRARAV